MIVSTCENIFLRNNFIFNLTFQLFNSYGPSMPMSKEERQRYLIDSYYFECDCEACRDDWPTEIRITNMSVSVFGL